MISYQEANCQTIYIKLIFSCFFFYSRNSYIKTMVLKLNKTFKSHDNVAKENINEILR